MLVLSHAHIDHSGNIPGLVKRGFRGDIICTAATRDLCATMLLDSAHIQEKDVEYVNRKREQQGKNLFEPLYTQEDAVAAMRYFVGVAYDHPREILPGVRLTLLDAGHMLGSAIVVLDIQNRAAGRDVRLVFSGDLGRPGIPIIRDPETVDRADLLIMESTYGDRLHEPFPDSEKELARIINETYRRGGMIIVPAFAVGRTQQLVYTLNRLVNSAEIPKLPVYVDSPLATNVTGVFRMHPEVYDAEIRQFLLTDTDKDPFGFAMLTYTRSVEESKELNSLHEPAIIISASGMAETGRILHHLKNRIEDPRNTILIVGFQAPDTLGRRLVERAPVVRIFGDEYRLKAHVEVLEGFSGHADRNDLLGWVGAMQQKPRRTFLVHGEEASSLALADGLRREIGLGRVDVPALHETVEV